MRNAEPAPAKFGPTVGTLSAGIDIWMRTPRIGLPYSSGHHRDSGQLWSKDIGRPIRYPKPDGAISLDRLPSSADDHDRQLRT